MRPTFALGGLALAVLVAGSGLALALRDDDPPAVRVRLAAAQRGPVTALVSAAGNTVDGARRDLAFGSSGPVTKVYVKVGTKVTKGQVLARIDGRAAREAYAAAKADLSAAQEALTTATTSTGPTGTGTAGSASTGTTGSTANQGTPNAAACPTPSASSKPEPPVTARPTPTTGSTGPATSPTPDTTAATPGGGAVPGAAGGSGAAIGGGSAGEGVFGPAGPPATTPPATTPPAAATPTDAPATKASKAVTPASTRPSDASPAHSRPPTATPTPTRTPTPTHEPSEPQPTVTVTATATVTATVTVTAPPPGGGTPGGGTPGGGTPGGGTPGGGHTSSPGTPSNPGEPSAPGGPSTPEPSATARPSTTAPPSPTARPTARPHAAASARPTGSCSPGTTSRGTTRTATTPKDGAARGGITKDQAAANVDRAEATLEEAADAVRATRIVAPTSGTVLSVAGRVGDTAGTGTFISLGNLNELQVQAMVTESDVNRLKLGQQAAITLATRPGERHGGTVTAIAPTATVEDQLVRYSVTLAFDEPPAGLMLGQTATVSVTTAEAKDAIYVPAAAVRSRSDGAQVVTVRAGGHDAAKVVGTGVRGDQYVQITSGLDERDQVVMSGTTTGEFPDGTWPGA
ncbi:efflux RND transporter periplasmic adaptor subunit [Nonomuraea sp. NPDC001023]|uniref:efflux RND transporter periplasmic adaptor subunit n=1 Tax=unclassified Nonomuraea TaxID=2593643 RepID=UPI0033283AF7